MLMPQTIKQTLTCLLLLCSLALVQPTDALAQPAAAQRCGQPEGRGRHGHPRFKPEEMQKKAEAFIIREAGLTPKEVETFFPLLNDMKRRQRDLHKKIGRALRRVEKEKLSEKDCEKILKEVVRLQRQAAELETKAYADWQRVLPAEKLLKVMKADREFGRKFFMKMTGKRR